MRDERANLMVKIKDQVNNESMNWHRHHRRAAAPRRPAAKSRKVFQPHAHRAQAQRRTNIARRATSNTRRSRPAADRDAVICRSAAGSRHMRGEATANATVFAEAFGKDRGSASSIVRCRPMIPALKGDTRFVTSPTAGGLPLFRQSQAGNGRQSLFAAFRAQMQLDMPSASGPFARLSGAAGIRRRRLALSRHARRQPMIKVSSRHVARCGGALGRSVADLARTSAARS